MYLVSALRRESFEGFQEFFSVFFRDVLQSIRCLLQGAHVLEAHFHVRRDLLVLAFPDEVGDGGDVRQDFAHEEGFLARAAEALREDVLQAGGEEAPDFIFPCGRKCMDDARAGVFGTCGVECGKDEVARLGRGEGGFDGRGIAHFSHGNDVGILTEGFDDAFSKTRRIFPDFPLVDEGFVRGNDVFDRVFEGNDVAGALSCGCQENVRERRALAASRGACDEDEAVLEGRELVQESFVGVGRECGELRQDTDRSSRFPSALVNMEAEAGISQRKGCIERAFFFV